MAKKIVTNDGTKGGLLKGKRHYDKQGNSLGGIKAVVTDSGNKPVELEGGEVIINREASKKYWKELSRINQSAGNGVAIGPPMEEEDPSEQYEHGGKIEFNPNHIPNKWILTYAKKIKRDYPEVWDKGGNIFGNEAFENLKRVAERGYWLDSEEWMYKKWRSYVARHIHDFRIEGVVAMLKWVDKVEKGWSYMKNLIEDEIKKQSTKKMDDGGKVKKYTAKKEKGVVFIYENGEKYGYLKTRYDWDAKLKKDKPYIAFFRISDNKMFKTNYIFQNDALQYVKDTNELFFELDESKMKDGGELEKGIKAEHEHSKTIDKFKREGVSELDVEKAIAKDHLKEDPNYYSKLEEMEAKKMVKGGKLDFNRPSPAISAQDVPPNAIGYGNSGLLYIASPNAKGVNQWKLVDKNGTNLQSINQVDGLDIPIITTDDESTIFIRNKDKEVAFSLNYNFDKKEFSLRLSKLWVKNPNPNGPDGVWFTATKIDEIREQIRQNIDAIKVNEWIKKESSYNGDSIVLISVIANILGDWEKAVEKASKNTIPQSNAPKARTTFTISANALNESVEKELADYRIKTEQEFIDEFGTNWRTNAGFTTSGSMDWTLGQRITEIADKNYYELILENVKNNRDITTSASKDINRNIAWNIDKVAYILDPIVSSSIEPTNSPTVHELNNYRIKTEQEFINEYGLDWKKQVNWSETTDMDWLFGEKITNIVKQDTYDEVLNEVKKLDTFISSYSKNPSIDPIWFIGNKMYMFDPALYAENVATNLGKNQQPIVISNEQLASKSKRDELFEEYSDLLFLIENTAPTDVVNMLALKQQAKKLKDEIDLMDLHLKEQTDGAINLLDSLFEASSIQPEHRVDLVPDPNGFAPNGQPTSLPKKLYDWSMSTPFQDWFGNFILAYNYKNSGYDVPCSVVVDKNYEPLVVYHGTGGEFSFFKFNQFPAMYFAENIDYSNWFAEQKGAQYGTGNGYIYPFFLNIRNPLDLTMFGIRDITPEEFLDWMYLQTGMDEDELKVSKALLGPTSSNPAWMYLRNSPEMLKVMQEKNIFDGIIYYENNPPQIGTTSYETKAYIIFESNSAKIADPNRHETILSSMRSFYLEKGGKL